MKYSFVTFVLWILLIVAMPLVAQETNSLFGTDAEQGLYGAIELKLTSLKNTDAVFAGAYGGWLIDHRLMLGLGGYALLSRLRARTEAEELYSPYGLPLHTRFHYGGVMVEYFLAPSRLIHLTARSLIGGGFVGYRDGMQGGMMWGGTGYDHGPGSVFVFVVEPSVGVELNITDWIRVAAEGGYRHVGGLDDLIGLDDSDLSSFNGSLILKFGNF